MRRLVVALALIFATVQARAQDPAPPRTVVDMTVDVAGAPGKWKLLERYVRDGLEASGVLVRGGSFSLPGEYALLISVTGSVDENDEIVVSVAWRLDYLEIYGEYLGGIERTVAANLAHSNRSTNEVFGQVKEHLEAHAAIIAATMLEHRIEVLIFEQERHENWEQGIPEREGDEA